MKRSLFIVGSLSAAVASCGPVETKLNQNGPFHGMLDKAEGLDQLLIGAHGMAREYSRSDISANFPLDSLDTPSDKLYRRYIAERFHSYRLKIYGTVDRTQSLSLADLYALPQQVQITRHDCVEGWSAIAQWQGPRLSDVLAKAGVRPQGRFVVFHCLDRDSNATPYYESLNLSQARHPQTLLALEQNGSPIVPDHGAPVRLRVPLQLGYKSAKWVASIEVVPSLAAIFGGNGGYWEDQGYEWYAGI